MSRRAALGLVLALSGCTAPAPAGPTEPAMPASDPEAPSETALASSPSSLELAAAERFAALALACVHREFPNKVAHVMRSPDDARSPSSLTPAFYGCFDWHSAVHGHWMLARIARTFPGTPLAEKAKAALGESLTPEKLAAEVEYQRPPERDGFERPYGLAWLLQLGAELREWDDPDARRWSAALRPLEELAVARVSSWIPKLTHPIRIGEHAQTAFAFGLMHDWAKVAGDDTFARLLAEHSRRLHASDRGCPLAFEPSGHDFLSPCLGAADLMRRVLSPPAFAAWLDIALPGIARDGDGAFLRPVAPSDRTDGKLVHLDGLNLSRAWMLEGIAAALPATDSRRAALVASARAHADAGLSAVSDAHYSGSHWLGTFAVYLVTARGLPPAVP
jgi:hypothetical protein